MAPHYIASQFTRNLCPCDPKWRYDKESLKINGRVQKGCNLIDDTLELYISLAITHQHLSNYI